MGADFHITQIQPIPKRGDIMFAAFCGSGAAVDAAFRCRETMGRLDGASRIVGIVDYHAGLFIDRRTKGMGFAPGAVAPVERPTGIVVDRREQADHRQIDILAFVALVPEVQRRQYGDDPAQRTIAACHGQLDIDRLCLTDTLLEIIVADPFARLAGYISSRRFDLEQVRSESRNHARGIGPRAKAR
jgi:hypothetical protein